MVYDYIDEVTGLFRNDTWAVTIRSSTIDRSEIGETGYQKILD